MAADQPVVVSHFGGAPKSLLLTRQQHVALLKDNVVLKYDVYSIAPYSEGHVELKIPYSRLNGILKPEWFPGRG